MIAGVDVDAKLDLGTISLHHGHTLTGVDAVASLALTLPASAPVEVAITSTKAACSEIQRRDARNNEVGIAHCNAGVATFPRLEPGTYLVCIDKHECHAIAVDDTPAQQKFTLVP